MYMLIKFTSNYEDVEQKFLADFKTTSRATAIEFIRCTFLRNSFNVLDYDIVSFVLSRTDKHSSKLLR